MSYDMLVPYWNGFFKEKIFFSYERCLVCGLLYAPIFFDGDQLAKLYSQMPPNMDTVPIEALRRTQRGYFDVLAQHSPLGNNYLEVGPDIGLFTENCVRNSHFNKYWLFEPNRAVWPILDKAMKNTHYEIVPEMFGFARIPDRSVSAAIMIHVLDHLPDPLAMLKRMREKLIPGAILIIVTHNESSMLRRIFGRRWPPFCLQHPQLYNPASMRATMKAAGFQTVEIRRTVNHFPLHFLIKHLMWAMGAKVKDAPSFGNISVGLKLGNMLAVAQVPGTPQ
jgi:hypothetical protein